MIVGVIPSLFNVNACYAGCVSIGNIISLIARGIVLNISLINGIHNFCAILIKLRHIGEGIGPITGCVRLHCQCLFYLTVCMKMNGNACGTLILGIVTVNPDLMAADGNRFGC